MWNKLELKMSMQIFDVSNNTVPQTIPAPCGLRVEFLSTDADTYLEQKQKFLSKVTISKRTEQGPNWGAKTVKRR
jgi:hypothetical protein